MRTVQLVEQAQDAHAPLGPERRRFGGFGATPDSWRNASCLQHTCFSRERIPQEHVHHAFKDPGLPLRRLHQ